MSSSRASEEAWLSPLFNSVSLPVRGGFSDFSISALTFLPLDLVGANVWVGDSSNIKVLSLSSG